MSKPRLQIRVTDRRTGVASDHGFTTGPVRIGREPGNELQLADPYVSAEHARLELDDTGVHLHDLGGTNGLRVAGRRLAPHTTLEIPHNLRVSLGPFDLEIVHNPDRDRQAASGALSEPGPADLEALHVRLRQLHALHTPYAAARQTFEAALADLIHSLHAAGDAPAARRVLAEFAPRDHAHLLLLGPSEPNQPPPTSAPPHLHLPLTPSLPPNLSLKTAPPPITPHNLSLPTAPPPITSHNLSLPIAPPPITPHNLSLTTAPPPTDPQPAPTLPPRSLASSLPAAPHPSSTSSPHRPAGAAPHAHITAAPRPARELALIAEAAQTLLPNQRPPASVEEARRFMGRLVLTLQTLAAGTGALQHLRLRQARDLGLAPTDSANPLLDMTTADELLAHLLAWRSPEPDRNHELLDALAVLLAHARAHVTATLAATRHLTADLAPQAIEQLVAASGPFRSRALWRGFLDRYAACLGDGAHTAGTLRQRFRGAYIDELQRHGLPLTVLPDEPPHTTHSA